MKTEREISETDVTRIAIYLMWGMVPTRKEMSGNIFRYWFVESLIETAVKRLGDPSMKSFHSYVQTLKSVMAEATAMKQAGRVSAGLQKTLEINFGV